MKKLLKKLIPDWTLSIYHWKLSLIGAVVFGFPSRKLKVIGITGTKGKSTVVMLAGRVLQETAPSTRSARSGQVGWVSSLTINDGKNEVMNPYHMTMPGRFFIQKSLAQMVKNGCEYALVEVTSEGIKQHRHRFIKWTGAVFTNLAPEHLEAHGGFENYRKAKEKLFAATAKNKNSFGVYNLDDENVEEFLKYAIDKKYGYGLSLRGAAAVSGGDAAISRDCFATLAMTDIKLSASGSEFTINGVNFKTKLLGEFNVYNCAAAATVGQVCGVSLEKASQALSQIQSIPGRLETINEGQNFTVVVDLAHTPDSYEKVFKLFKGLKNSPHPNPLLEKERGKASKIIAIFGSAGGGRDKWKRPELGRIASENADILIICNEDPYDENPQEICQQIAAGCKKTQPEIILNRREALAKGLSLAQAGDIVLFLGKGTEQTYVEGPNRIKWDDREVAREELKKLLFKK